MKKLLVTTLVLGMFAAMLGGCSSSSADTGAATETAAVEEVLSEASAETTAARSEGVTLSFGLHQAAVPSSGILQEICEDFEAETGIKIDLQIAPDGQWKDMLNVKLGANEAPDLFCTDVTPASIKSVVNPEENCLDLTDEEFVSRMTPATRDCFTYNDRVYGTSLNGNKMWLYFYNKDVFERLNLEVPTTYEEFKNVCQAIKDDGMVPIYEATPSAWHQVLPLFECAGSYLEDDPDLYEKLNNNEIDIKDVEGLNTIIHQMNEFAELGFYGEDYLSNNIEEDMAHFAAGECAIVLNTQGWGEMIQEEYPEMEGKIGFFVMPWNDNQVLGVNPSGGGIFGYKKTEHEAEVRQFINYISSPEVLQKYHEGNPNSMELGFEGIEAKYPQEYLDYFDSLEKEMVMQVGVTYVDPNWNAIGKDIEAMYAGMMTPEEVLEGISQKRLDSAILQNDPAFTE